MKASRIYVNFNVSLGTAPTTTYFISGSNRVADIDVNESKQTARVTDDNGNCVVLFMGGGGYYVPKAEDAKG